MNLARPEYSRAKLPGPVHSEAALSSSPCHIQKGGEHDNESSRDVKGPVVVL